MEDILAALVDPCVFEVCQDGAGGDRWIPGRIDRGRAWFPPACRPQPEQLHEAVAPDLAPQEEAP